MGQAIQGTWGSPEEPEGSGVSPERLGVGGAGNGQVSPEEP